MSEDCQRRRSIYNHHNEPMMEPLFFAGLVILATAFPITVSFRL